MSNEATPVEETAQEGRNRKKRAKTKDLPDCRRLHELFSYDVETGKLYWRERPLEDFRTERAGKTWNSRYAGTEVGCISKDGYRVVEVDGAQHMVHRVVFVLLLGYVGPEEEIDHINGVKDDNRIFNLRAATNAENQRNRRGAAVHNLSTGIRGVRFYTDKPRRRPYQAYVQENGHQVSRSFATEAEASIAVRQMRSEHYGDFAGEG
jgi:hypothetical protein